MEKDKGLLPNKTLTHPKENLIFCFCTLLGGIILVSSTDLLTLFLGVELQSYSLYLIASSTTRLLPHGIKKSIFLIPHAKEPSEAAGLKYFLLGALASALILLGIGILYAVVGSTNFYVLSSLISSSTDSTSALALSFDLANLRSTEELSSYGSIIPSSSSLNLNMKMKGIGLLFILIGLI
jgi:NADH:ubiquinone oxidoreductase subunit 2 (subunit N)